MLDDLAAAIGRHAAGLWGISAVPNLSVVALDGELASVDLR